MHEGLCTLETTNRREHDMNVIVNVTTEDGELLDRFTLTAEDFSSINEFLSIHDVDNEEA